ncbi:MAG: hypothetical protein NT040_12080 [Bacteroidetes bacterium]|nr:hypothetical protein [Bacteroidota bacterium]
MKKIMFLMLAAILSVTVFAQEKKMTEIKVSQLPKPVSEYVAKNLGGGAISKAGKIEENGVLSYVAMVDMAGQKRAFLFDKDGKFTGKGDNLKSAPAAKPPVKAPETKPSTQTPAAGIAVPKK